MYTFLFCQTQTVCVGRAGFGLVGFSGQGTWDW